MESIKSVLINAVLHSSSSTKCLVLLVLVLLGSPVYSFDLFQPTYFGNKRNFLNRNFAKLGWGWTLICIVPISLITSSLYTRLRVMATIRHFSRIAIGHAIFYCITILIVTNKTLSESLGQCSSSQYENFIDCHSNGAKWIEFDISGHTFLLAYCILVITEECRSVKTEVWERYRSTLLVSTKDCKVESENLMMESSNSFLLTLYKFFSPTVRLLEVVACIEIFLMVNLFVATQMYHHTFIEKILGYLLAVICWMVTYKWLYGRWHYGPCAVISV